MLEDQFPTSETVERPVEQAEAQPIDTMGFPRQLLDRRNFLLWRKKAGGAGFAMGHYEPDSDRADQLGWVWSPKWKERSKHTLQELLPTLKWLREQAAQGAPGHQGMLYHLAFFPEDTNCAVLDFDNKAFAQLEAEAAGDPEKLARFAKGKQMMADWVEDLKGYTYVEQSKTPGSSHALLWLSGYGRSIGAMLPEDADDDARDATKLPMDCLGTGLIVLTGDQVSEGNLIHGPTPDDKAYIESLWDKRTGQAASDGCLFFNGRQVMVDHERMKFRSVIPDTGELLPDYTSADKVREAVVGLNERYQWYLTGEGDAPSKGELHQQRLDFIQAMFAASKTFIKWNAFEVVEEVLFSSYFATDYTPANATSNPDRFTNPAHVKRLINHEIPLGAGLAYEAEQSATIGIDVATLAAMPIEEREAKYAEAKAAQMRIMFNLAVGEEQKKKTIIEAAANAKLATEAELPWPKMPEIPQTGLFKLVYDDVSSKTRGLAKEDYIAMTTLFVVGQMVSLVAHYGVQKTNPSMIGGADTGSGKNNPEDYMGSVRDQCFTFEQILIAAGSVGSPEGLRDAVAPNKITQLINSEAGGFLLHAVDGSTKGMQFLDYLMQTATATLVDFPALANSKDNVEKKITKKNFTFNSLFLTQTHKLQAVLNETWIESGGSRFFTFLPKPPPKGKPGSKFSGVASQQVVDAFGTLAAFNRERKFFTFDVGDCFPNEEGDAGDQFTDRVLVATRALQRNHALAQVQRRMNEMAVKWATVHAAGRMLYQDGAIVDLCKAPENALNPGQKPWLAHPYQLEEVDKAFGLEMVRCHADTLLYLTNTDASALMTTEAYDILVWEAILRHAKDRAEAAGAKGSALTLQACNVVRGFGSTGKRGRRPIGSIKAKAPKDTKIKDDYFAAMCDDRALVGVGKTNGPYVMTQTTIPWLEQRIEELKSQLSVDDDSAT